MAFGNTAKKRIVREADKIASMKQELDALSWGRVQHIGKQLQSKYADPTLSELGSELIAIAQSNVSLAAQLGIESTPYEHRTTPSGMGVIQGGLVDAAFGQSVAEDEVFEPQEPVLPEDKTSAAVGSDSYSVEVSRREASHEAIKEVGEFAQVEQVTLNDLVQAILEAQKADSENGEREKPVAHHVSSALFEPDDAPETLFEQQGLFAEKATQASEELKLEERPLKEPAPKEPAPKDSKPEQPTLRAEELTPEEFISEAEEFAPEEPLLEVEDTMPEKLTAEAEELASGEPTLEKPAPAEVVSEESSLENVILQESDSREPLPEEEAPAPPEQENQSDESPFARFRNLYESRDGSLCVFEDENGHLVAVDASKLA